MYIMYKDRDLKPYFSDFFSRKDIVKQRKRIEKEAKPTKIRFFIDYKLSGILSQPPNISFKVSTTFNSTLQ